MEQKKCTNTFKKSTRRYVLAATLSGLLLLLFFSSLYYINVNSKEKPLMWLWLTAAGIVILGSIINDVIRLRKALEKNTICRIDVDGNEIKVVYNSLQKVSAIPHAIILKENKYWYFISFLLFFSCFNFKDMSIILDDNSEIIIDSYLFETNKIYNLLN